MSVTPGRICFCSVAHLDFSFSGMDRTRPGTGNRVNVKIGSKSIDVELFR